MTRTRTERPALTDEQVYDRHAAMLQERLVPALNAALGLTDAEHRVTFGYLGNLSPQRDDRAFYVFLPHPGRIGTDADHIGGYASGDLAGIKQAVAEVRGALRMATWMANR